MLNCTPFEGNRTIDRMPSRERRRLPFPFDNKPVFPEFKNPINPFSDLKENPFLNPKNKYDSLLPNNTTSTLSPPNNTRPFTNSKSPLDKALDNIKDDVLDEITIETNRPTTLNEIIERELLPPDVTPVPIPDPNGVGYPMFPYIRGWDSWSISYWKDRQPKELLASGGWWIDIPVILSNGAIRNMRIGNNFGDVSTPGTYTYITGSPVFNLNRGSSQEYIDEIIENGNYGGDIDLFATEDGRRFDINYGRASVSINGSPVAPPAPPKPKTEPKTPVIPRPSRQPGTPNVVPFKRPKKKPLPVKPEPKPKEEPKPTPLPDTAPNKPKPVFIPFIRPKIVPKPEPVKTPDKPKFDPLERPKPKPFKRPDRERRKHPIPSPNTTPKPNRKPNPPNNDPYKNRDRQTNNPSSINPNPMPTINTPWGECSCPVPPNNGDDDSMVVRWENVTVREGKPVQNPITRQWTLEYTNKTVSVLGSSTGSMASKVRAEWEHRNQIQEDLVAARNQRNGLVSVALATSIKVKAVLATQFVQQTILAFNVASNVVMLMHLTRGIGEELLDLIDYVYKGVVSKFPSLQDDEGNDVLPLTDRVGFAINDFIADIIGTENYTKFRASIAVNSRIYHAAYSVVDTVRDFTSTSWRLAEITVGNIGKVGNALKRSGQVFEDSYDELEETFFGGKPNLVGRLTEKLDRVEDGIDAVASVAYTTGSAIAAKNEISEEYDALQDELDSRKDDLERRAEQIKQDSLTGENLDVDQNIREL